jgi:hypothetical protein
MESSALDSRHPVWGGITQTPKPLGGAKGLETFEPASIRCPIGSGAALGVSLGCAIGVALGGLVVVAFGVGL